MDPETFETTMTPEVGQVSLITKDGEVVAVVLHPEDYDKLKGELQAFEKALDLPFVSLPGSEDWESARNYGDALEKHFPGQDAHDFASACNYNGWGPLATTRLEFVRFFNMLQQGERDEGSWIWQIQFDDGSIWQAEGHCDYTGWDCQSWLEWEKIR